MEGNGFDRRPTTDNEEKVLAPEAGALASAANAAEKRKKYIEDVDDLDLYMKIYPEVKRRRDEAERQVKLVEAEIKRREHLRFFASGQKSLAARILHNIRSPKRSVP
jgi:hypothetical protein